MFELGPKALWIPALFILQNERDWLQVFWAIGGSQRDFSDKRKRAVAPLQAVTCNHFVKLFLYRVHNK